MYSTLITKIGETLEKVKTAEVIASYHKHPKTDIQNFPAVMYLPQGFTNTFETTTQNTKVYRFLLMVIVGIEGEGMDAETAFTQTLPAVVDAIVAEFDKDWDQGTLGGGRVTAKLDSADVWELSEDQDGLTAYAPLNLEIMTVGNINTT